MLSRPRVVPLNCGGAGPPTVTVPLKVMNGKAVVLRKAGLRICASRRGAPVRMGLPAAAEGRAPPSEKMSGVRVPFWLSRLGDARERRRAIGWLAALAGGGFGLTMLFLTATGRGTDRWFFILVVWLALIFIPLWLVTAAFETLGPALRVRMARNLAGRLDRYGSLPGTAVLVEDLFAKQGVMPRINTPPQGYKVREAAGAGGGLANRQPPALETLHEGVGRCLGGVEAWARDLGGWADTVATPGKIQVRWGTVGAL